MSKFENKSEGLRDLLADQLTDIIKNGAVVADEDGKALRVTASPAYFAVARALVKDFPPTTVPTHVSPVGVLGDHLKSLPFTNKAEAH